MLCSNVSQFHHDIPEKYRSNIAIRNLIMAIPIPSHKYTCWSGLIYQLLNIKIVLSFE